MPALRATVWVATSSALGARVCDCRGAFCFRPVGPKDLTAPGRTLRRAHGCGGNHMSGKPPERQRRVPHWARRAPRTLRRHCHATGARTMPRTARLVFGFICRGTDANPQTPHTHGTARNTSPTGFCNCNNSYKEREDFRPNSDPGKYFGRIEKFS